MEIQYIEDPETKQQISFEWDKPEPPTSTDIDSLFKSVKGRTINPPPEGVIRPLPFPTPSFVKSGMKAVGFEPPPSLLPITKTTMEIGGFAAGGPFGYAGAKQAEKLLPHEVPSVPRPQEEAKPLGLSRQDIEKAIGRPITPQEWQQANEPFISPKSVLGKVMGTAGEVSKDIGEGILFGKAGEVISKVLPKILPFYARGKTPGAEKVMDIAKREGVYIPAADVTGSTTQAAISSSLQKLPQSGYTMQREAEKAMSTFSNMVEGTLTKTGGRIEPQVAGEIGVESIPQKMTTDIESQLSAVGGKLSKPLTGQSIQEGIATAKQTAKEGGGIFFNEAKGLSKDLPVDYEPLTKAIEKVRKSTNYEMLSEPDRARVEKIITTLENRIQPPEVEGFMVGGRKIPIKGREKEAFTPEMRAELFGEEAEPMTYLGAEGLRRTVNKHLYSAGVKDTPAFEPIKRIAQGLEDSMEASAKTAGSEAHEAFKIARDFWKTEIIGEFGERGKQTILGRIEKASPEQILNIIKSLSADDLKKLVGVLPKDTLASLKRGLYTELYESGSTVSKTGETIYNGSQISKAIKSIGKDRLTVLFSPDEVRYLRDAAVSGAKTVPLSRLGAGSPERAIQQLKSAPLKDLELFKANMGDEQFREFRQGLLTQIFQKASSTSRKGEIIYNGQQIAKELFGKGGLGEARLAVLTTPEELTFLKDLAMVGERMGSSWRIAGNPSGTAHTLYILHLLGQVGSGVGAVFGGEQARKKWGTGAGLMTTGAFLSPYILSKLITSNIGRQYLISGFPKLEKKIGSILPYGIIAGKPEKKE